MPNFFSPRKFSFLFLRFLTLFALLAATFAAVRAAPVEKPVEQPVAPRPLQTAVPAVTLGLPASAPVGSNVSFTVSFKNNDTQTGYGPFVDMVLDTTGPDGVYPGAAASDLYDGLGASLISASYLGVPFVLNSTMWVLEFDAAGHANHPLARDASGAPIVVSAPPGFTQGDKLVVFRLPFGSFVNTQPAAVIDVTVNMSPLADIGVNLNVAARGGFQYGLTALDDWCCDPVANTISGWNTGAVKPSLFTLTKSYSGPEDEAAAGPNFRTFYPMQYTVSAAIAAGQTMTNLVLTDVLPANLQAVTLISSSPAGATCSPIPAAPGGTLSCDWGATAVSGTASFTFDFYIPTGVIPPASGDDIISCNNASATAFWSTPDGRDSDQTISEPNPDTGACEHTLTDKSIAVQKGVTVVGGGQPAPGKQLEYTLTFQVADDFAFQNVVVSDVISDGQHYDPTFTPTLTLTEHGAASSGAFNLANVNVDTSQIGNDVNPATNGSTTINFNVSDERVTRSLDAKILGGCVPTGGTASVDCSASNGGATSGTIVFRTLIQENFTDTYPSGDPSVDQGDILDDLGNISGDVLSTVTLAPTGLSEADGTAASVSIGYGQIAKSIYAVTNGNTGVTTLNPSSVKVGAGDMVTYKIEYSLPTSDFEGLTLTDYLPLPVFAATEVTTFTNAVCNDLDTGVPAAGKACLGTGDNYHSLPGAISPALTTDAAGNSVKWTYGNYDSTSNSPSKIELVFTVTVRDDPFADGLYLTNQANATETSTQSNSSDGNSIVQIQLTEPVLVGEKGIVASSNPAAVYSPATPAPLAFTAPGSAGSRWSGVINSAALAATPIDSDISGVDAGDLVTFAIVIQNTGSGINGAFDITITDTLDALGFEFPTLGDPNSLNLRIAYGDSASAFSPISYTKPDDTPAAPDDLFNGGIKLVDPAGAGVCQAHDPNTGNNVIIITYDLRVKSGIQPGTYINTASITNFSGTEGGPNFASGLTDTAQVTTAQPALAKTLTSSEENYAGNSSSQAVIGELVNYTLTLTVPEGALTNAVLTDTMAPGLAFVQVNSVTLSPGVASSKTIGTGATPANVTIGDSGGGTGNQLVFDFGTITNSDTDNAVTETIAIEVQAITLNVTGNQAGTVLANNASFVADAVPAKNAGPVNITIVEPDVNITKTAVKVLPAPPPATFDAGDTIEFTITVTNPNPVNAYDVILSDTFSALIDPATLTVFSVTDSATALTTADFQFAANVLSTKPGSEFDLPAAGARTVTVKVRGNIVSTFAVTAPAQSLTNTARTAWTSINGTRQDYTTANTASDERTGVDGPGAGLNNYAKDATSTALTMTAPTTAKYMVATSETNTAEPTAPFQPTTTGTAVPLTIGEIVRYRLSVAIPEGVITNFRIQDYLPNGLTFLNDGTAKAAFVSTSGNITSSDYVVSGTFTVPGVTDVNCQITGAAVTGNTPAIPAACPALADNNISTLTASNNDVYATGTDISLMLGTLTNASDNDTDSEYVIVEFNALLDNNAAALTSNDLGEVTNLFNRFRIYINNTLVGGYSNSVYNVVQEPVITNLLKTATPNTGDAGDTIAYQVTFTNINGASLTNVSTAYDVILTDTLPAKMDNATFGGVDGVDYIFTPAACGVYGSNPTPFSGNTLTLNFTSLNPGCQVTVNYTARLMTSVNPGESLVNAAHLTYTSLPGSGTSGNPTGSTTPGASGTGTGERDGQGVNPPNDYFDDSNAPVTVTQISPVKSLVSTSDALTLADNLTIGEVARFRLAMQVAEGASPAFVVTDYLPAGMQFLDDGSAKFAFVSNGAGVASSTLTCANDSGSAADLVGLPSASVDCALSASGGPFSDGVDPVFSLGDLTNSDSDADNEYVVVEFNAVLLNDGLNQDTRAPMPVNSFGVSINAAAPVVSNDLPLTVVEPNLTVAKDVASISAQIDAGGTVTYQVVLTNTGSAPAYDSQLTDTLPAVLSLTAGSASVTFSGGASGFTDNNPSGAGNLVDVTIGLIPVGGSATITYSATILNSITPAQAVDNTATVTWTSLSGADANERDGSGLINNYRTSDPAQFTSDTISVAKSILATSEADTPESDPRPLAIGEVLRYRLAVAIPEGSNPSLTLTDQLALGVIEPIFDTTTQISTLNLGSFTSSAYGAGLEAAASGPVALHDGSAFVFPGLVDYNPATGLLTFNLGDILNNDSDAEVEYLYIDFNVVVLNSAANNAGSVFANTFSAAETGLGPITSNSVSATLVEPSLTLAKSVDDVTWVYGQTLTYTLNVSASAAANTSSAYELLISDTVPTGLSYVAASASTPAGCALDDSAAPLLTWTCASLAPGASLTFTFQAQVLAPPNVNAIVTGDNVTNNADLVWTSLPGAGTTGNATGSDTPGAGGAANGERNGSGGVNDYVTSGSVNGGLDAYYALGNRVWYDTDNSATLNGSEKGVPGVKVWLYAADGVTRILEPDGVTPREALTDANGYYLFDYLPAGDYIVVLPAANFAASTPLEGYWSSQTQRNADGSISESAAVSPENDLDSDDNGTLTAGEVRSDLVTLGANAEPTLEGDTSGTQGDQPDNRANMTVDFGFYKVNIGNLVYEDVNANGTFDAGDTPLDGVTVELLASDGTLITSTTTAGGGLYAFTNLPAGDYRVRVSTPADMLSTIDSADAADSTAPDTHTDNNDNGIGLGAASLPTVTSGLLTMSGADFGAADAGYPLGVTTDTSLDFGFVYAYALGNRVWFDTDNSHTINGAEVGVDGVLVELYRASDLTTPIASDTTSGGGFYLFDDLNPDDYVVVLPASNFSGAGKLTGYWSSQSYRNPAAPYDVLETAAPSPEGGVDSDDNGTLQTGTVVAQTVTLGNSAEPIGESNLESGLGQGAHPDNRANMTVDFGFYKVSVGNLVWADANRDGAFTGGEPVFSGAAVTLYAADGVTVLATTSTDASGLYRFDNLPDGDYIISVVAPTGTVSTRDDFAGAPGDSADANQNYDDNDNGLGLLGGETFSSPFTLTAGASGLQGNNLVDDGSGALVDFGATHNPTLDFGFTPVYSLGNRVWLDTNNDRLMNLPGELGVDGVTVQLYAAADLTTVLQTQTTANGGYYLFNNLEAGDYVVVIPAENFDNTGVGDSTTALVGYWSSETQRNSSTGALEESLAHSPETGEDLDDNGTRDTSGGAFNNAVVSQVVTLGPTFNEPTGESDTDGTLPGSQQGQPDNQANMTVDFGFYTMSLGNLVWDDADNSGLVNGAEAGIDGVTLELYAVDGSGSPLGLPLATATTVGGGNYTFSGLAQGNYLVRLPESNFLGGGALRDYYSSTGGGAYEPAPNPDFDTTDSDDNGSQVGSLGFTGGYIQSGVFSLSPAAEASYDNATGSTSEPRVDFGVFKSLIADLSITKDDGVTAYVPGGSLTYTITVSNAGPSDAPGSVVADALPAQIASWAWVCSGATGGATGCDGAASNSANFSDTVDLPAGSSITYTVTAQLASSATGSLTNTVSVTPPTGVTDGTPGDNTASDTDTEAADANLSLTKDDGKTYYLPGSTFSYTIIINNAGPSDVIGADVSDLKPAQITSWDWACVTTLGATCTPQTGLTGDFADKVNLPAGSSITYTVTVTIDPAASGDLVNTATVSHPSDTTPGDNTDTDTDNPASILVTKDDGVTIAAPGALLTYTITVQNVGAVDLTSLIVTDTLQADVTFQSATPTPSSTPPTGTPGGTLTWNGLTLAAGASTTFQLTVKVADTPVASSLTNSVDVADNGTGVSGGATDTDTISVSNAKSIIATNQADSLPPQVFIGEILTYQISLDIPFGVMTNLTTLDVVDSGLAFVRCVSIDPGALTTDLPGGFTAACADPTNPTVQAEPIGDPQAINQGRRALFNFGNVTNASPTDETLTVTYEVVVLDVAANLNGTTGLNNSVLWAWDGGSLEAVAPPVEVIEPELSIDKNASPDVLPYGSAVTFTIDIAHTAQSAANAYDVVVTDALPAGLSYIAGSIAFSGLAPTTYAYDSTSHILTFNWTVFPLGQTSKISFQASFIGPSPVTNAASVAWTSLPLDPGQQSDYNTESTERWYDPTDLTGLDNYGAKDSVVITAPVLPATGFAPDRVTALAAQPADKRYQSLAGMWLEIPALNLTMPVTGVPLSSAGWDLTWLSRQAGYLQGTTYPGQVGTTGITGHVTLADGTPGPFRNLGKLFWGNQVILHADGYRYIYEVREQRTVLPRDLSVFKQDGYTWMTLLTCDGYVPWLDTYNYRLAVRAVLLKVEVDTSLSPYNGRTQPLMDGR
ncbi:MAG: hypothetical protein OHK0031_00630 [Anaerolineales bacterium]